MTVLVASARTRDLATAVADGSLAPFYAVATATLVALTLYWTNDKREEGSAWR